MLPLVCMGHRDSSSRRLPLEEVSLVTSVSANYGKLLEVMRKQLWRDYVAGLTGLTHVARVISQSSSLPEAGRCVKAFCSMQGGSWKPLCEPETKGNTAA